VTWGRGTHKFAGAGGVRFGAHYRLKPDIAQGPKVPLAEVETGLPPPSALPSIDLTRQCCDARQDPARTTVAPQKPVWLLSGSGTCITKGALDPIFPEITRSVDCNFK